MAWKHSPLTDPFAQIRLLSISLSEDEDYSISCTSHIYDRDKAPQYNAISYTWGDAQDTRIITIDGQPLEIRSNCYYALWQTQLHHPSEPIWVDSICINQRDLLEKGVQVSSIGLTFSQAARVFACVGRHTPSSQKLQLIVAHGALAHLFEPCLDIDTSGWNEAILRVDRHYVTDLAIAVSGFVYSKPYLERLWVAQEIFEGRGRLLVLCGKDTMSWKNWQKLVFLGTAYFDMIHMSPPTAARLPQYFLAMSDLVNTRQVVTFPEILESASVLQCENPMDRIYGIIGLIDWDSDCLLPLHPDYRISTDELAVEAMRLTPRKNLANAGRIVNALEVDMSAEMLLDKAVRMPIAV